MTIAAKHFDPQIGIDVHAYSAPPGVYPTPYIGIVLDPFDYIPVIGATVEIRGIKAASAGTGGFGAHIPVGVWTPPIFAPGGPQIDQAEIFMGSRTVEMDGQPFSRIAMPVLDCNMAGMIPPFRLNKVKRPTRTLTLPTALNLSTPCHVLVGGPPTISLMAMAMKGLFAGLGKLAKKVDLSGKFKRLRQKMFGRLPDGTFLKCKILRAEPVDIRDGSVAVEHEDFSVPGRLPLVWSRCYSSTRDHAGACGHGWHTPADLRLEIDADGFVLFHAAERLVLFPRMPDAPGEAQAVLEFLDGARLWRERTEQGEELVVRTKDDLRYRFVPWALGDSAPLPGPRVLDIEGLEDRFGNGWKFERRQGHLVRIVETTPYGLRGRFIEVASRDGRLHQMQLHDPETGNNHPLVSYQYDKQGDLTAALDALEQPRRFYYRQHRMVRHSDRTGLSFYYAYDAQWRVVHAWGDGGLYDYRFQYDDLMRETVVTDSLGHVSRIQFDENLLPLCEVDPLDGMTVFEYDDAGRTVAVTDPSGLCTEFEYDERGNLLKLIRPDGSVVKSEYDADDRLVTLTDPSGAEWTRRYDERGLLIEQADPLGASTRYEWNTHGQLIEQTDPRGAAARLAYDRHGQLAEVTDPLGHVSRYRFDPLGRLLTQRDPLDRPTDYIYDKKGRLLRIAQSDGREVQCDYDAEDQLLRYIDEAGAETRLEYTGIGQIGRRIQPDGHTVEYRYDTEEQLTGLTNQRGERYELHRDPLGRIVEEIDYWGQSRQYRYDAAGRLQETVDPLGRSIRFETDELGRIVKKTFDDIARPGRQEQERFVYDKRGLLKEMRNRNRQVKRAYDVAGRLTEEDQDGFKVHYRYDEVGNRIERSTSAGNKVVCAYDLRNQVTAIAINGEAPITLERDALGRTTKEQLGEHIARQFEYDARDRLTAQTVLQDAAPLFETRYDYDRAGNLTRRSDSQQGEDCYEYDVLGRLLAHTDPKGKIAQFLNDPAGDRLQTRIKQTRLKKVVNGNEEDDVLWTREGRYEGVHYVFDRAGNLVYRGDPDDRAANDNLELVWDANQRLAESRRNGETTQYGYDPLGRRVFKRNPTYTTWFYWDGDALLGEVRQANDAPEAAPIWTENVADFIAAMERKNQLKRLHEKTREYVYYPGTFVPLALVNKDVLATEISAENKEWIETIDDNIVVFSKAKQASRIASSVYYYHTDPNGCPTRLADVSGQVRWSVGYEAWAGIADQYIGQISNLLRLQGQYFDAETGLHYNRYRYYDPDSGSFVGQDPIGLSAGENVYAFGPNVLGWSDSLGLALEIIRYKPRDSISAALGARATAIDRAWALEKRLIELTGEGTRNWSSAERARILSTPNARLTSVMSQAGYTGHHINSVEGNGALGLRWRGDPRNIVFLTNHNHSSGINEHVHALQGHRGNTRNNTRGRLIDRQAMIDRFLRGCRT